MKKYSIDFLSSLYTTMYKIRNFEEQGIKLYRQGHIRGYFHPYWGEEAIATGVCSAMNPDDYITSTHRGHGHCLAWGADLNRMFAELLGKKAGYCKGLGGSMHIADYSKGNLGANGIVGSGTPIAVGAALGASIRGEKKVVATFVSDGGSNIGSFLEGLNLAAAWKLPVIFVIENNQYAVSTPIEDSTGETQLYKRGIGFGVESVRIDGNDVLQVYETAKAFVDRCRKGEGPFLIEAVTFRKSGHHVNDPGLYLPKEKVEYYEKHDPLKIGAEYLRNAGLSDEQLAELQDKVMKEIKVAVDFAVKGEEMSKEEFLNFVEGY
ncbi:MAG: thiamine pyrophosphate-dependent dehydrogenase E1 component subunit alpha [Bacteroidales bacterium]|nr:thiamine pyrophosphate-dependent dehydrogenase E1 component subunit alpha [Bacteroidales bacterium]